MKKKNSLILSAFVILSALINMGLSHIQKNCQSNELKNVIKEAKADGESVYCKWDQYDTCIVGSTQVPDYDEGCTSWFWS